MEIVNKRIIDLVESNIHTLGKIEVSQFNYIDISSIDNVKKEIIQSTTIPMSEAPSRAKFILRKNDILISNVRPNLNAVALVGDKYDGAIGSSGFTVLRAKNHVNPKYLFFQLISPSFIEYVNSLVQGAMYPAISNSDVKNYVLRIPKHSDDQERIASQLTISLSNIEQMRQAALRQRVAIKAMQGALLREVLPYKSGDVLPAGWKWETLEEIYYEDKRLIQPFEEDFGKLQFIGMENIVSGTREFVPSMSKPPESSCFMFNETNVLFGKLRPYLNKVFLPSTSGKCSMELIPLKPKDSYSRDFLAALLQSEQVMESTAKNSTGGRMPRADLKRLSKVKVALPDNEVDCNLIGKRMKESILMLINLRDKVEKQLAAIEATPAAVLREAFEFKTQ